VPSWSRSIESWGWAPSTATATGLLPDASVECWSAGFIPEARFIPKARGTWLPVVFVGGPQLNHATSPLELMSRATISPVGPKAMRPPLIKLQSFDGTGSLEIFLTTLQHMASYLHLDNEDMFHHLCANLEEAVGQVVWDIGPCATTANIVQLLQTRFGTQLQAERFKAKWRATRRPPGESIQQLYQEICKLVTLAYPSAEALLVTHVP